MKNLNFKILLDNQKSKRSKDNNGYLIVKDNPIALSGVYDYLLSEISDNDNSDEIVKVCREFSDLEKNKDLFKDKPIIWEHKWTGETGENQSVDGVISGDIEAKNGGLYADLIIFNSDLIKAIEKGECYELSPGYEAEIIAENGSYNGEHYDYKQLLQNVNHLAVVEQGRTGHELRIQDKSIQGEFMEKKFTLKALMDALRKITDEGEVAEAEVKDGEAEAKDECVSDSDEILKAIIEVASNGDLGDDDKKAKIKEILKIDEKIKDEGEVAKVEIEPKDDEKVVEEISADEIIKAIEKITDSKVKKAMNEFKSDTKKISDSIDEVKAIVGDFDTTNLGDINGVYRLGYEIITGCKLADGLDSKTAFKMEVAKRRPTAIKDENSIDKSENSDKLMKLVSRF